MKINFGRKLLFPLNILLTLGTFVFAYIYGSLLISEVDFTSLNYALRPLIGSIILFILFYGILSIHWMLICFEVDKKFRKNQILVFFASQPYKYLPTSLFTFSYRAKYAKDVGMSLKRSSAAQFIEIINIVFSGALIATVFSLLDRYFGFGLLLLSLCTVILLILYQINVMFSIPFVKLKIPSRSVSKYMVLVGLGWVVAGVSFYLLGKAFGLDNGLYESIASNAGALIAGILAFFAPGGIGVRELVFTAFGIQSLMIVLWRMLTFIVDIVVGGLAILYITSLRIRKIN